MSDLGSADEAAKLSIAGSVATLTLNRPEARNALDAAMARTLRRHVLEIEASASIRVVVVNGSGAGFCAGGDIRLVADHLDGVAPLVHRLLADLHEFLCCLRRMPKIVLTSVHGAAAGAGLSLAMMGDLCVAADNARFVTAYAKLGVSPDCGGTVGIVEALGIKKAMQLFLLEDELSAAQAESFGLVNKVFPASELAGATAALAARLSEIEPSALEATKRLLNQSPYLPLAQQLASEGEALIACMQTPRYREKVQRFLGWR